MNNEKNIIVHTHQMASGRFRWQVVDRKGHVVKEAKDWEHNLILNAGMERVAANTWVDNFPVCAVGTGTTANTEDSGVTTATQAGTTVTLAGGVFVFSAANATGGGDVIAWDSSQRARITAYTSPTQVTVAENQSVSAGEFTLAHTNQTGLVTPVKYYSGYLTGAANCNTTRSGNVLLHRRTYDFTAEVGPVTYNEVGLNWAANNTSVFSRMLLPVGGVTVLATQQIRVIYELMLALTPTTPQFVSGASVFVGWPHLGVTNSNFYQQLVKIGMSSVSTSGTKTNFDAAGDINEPAGYYNQNWWFSSNTWALPTFPGAGPGTSGYLTPPSGTSYPLVMAAYVAYNFYRDRGISQTTAQNNYTNIKCMGCGNGAAGFGAEFDDIGWGCRFDQYQTKDSEHTMTFNWRISWNRNIIV